MFIQRWFSIGRFKVSFYFKDACKPGYWSTYGTPECSLCPIGSYSNNFGASKCTECPFSKSTDTEGTNDESFCESKFNFTSILFSNLTSEINIFYMLVLIFYRF